MIAELDLIVLTEALPQHGLGKGAVGTVVHILEPDKAYEVEFMTFQGETLAVLTLFSSQIRGLEPKDIPYAAAANHELPLAA
jgi:hypothetical protein